jgi:pimeloyl-ACP methyl ester carboxylesterase
MSLTATHTLDGLTLRDLEFQVPLDHAAPAGETLTVFAREVLASDTQDKDLPYLLFLQGGPGFPSPRPTDSTGWLGWATQRYRVLLLDQRGTGRSSPLHAATITARGDAQAQADHLSLFRADAIVEDCELIRTELTDGRPWTILGQSFGGFCAVRYLSAHPEGLSGVLITGGLPPLSAHPDDIYRRTYPICASKNRAWHERYPVDEERARKIVRRLDGVDVRLASGDRLSPRRFQMLGMHLGMSDGREMIHYLLEDAFPAGSEEPVFHRGFLRAFENSLSFDTNPIFTLLQEACYTQGFASDWSAERLRPEFPEFHLEADQPVYLTGEMMWPGSFDELGALRPMKEAAELLAQKEDWPTLYDREALAANEVPVAAAVYENDMYVDREYSLETAEAIQGAKVWRTADYEHNGLRADGATILGHLMALLRG